MVAQSFFFASSLNLTLTDVDSLGLTGIQERIQLQYIIISIDWLIGINNMHSDR